jgi:hypothetical protein
MSTGGRSLAPFAMEGSIPLLILQPVRAIVEATNYATMTAAGVMTYVRVLIFNHKFIFRLDL